MAFRQHSRPQPSRQLSFQATVSPPPQRQRASEESEEWVLFSPTAPSTTARTHTTSTERTPTAGLSRLSDFGSLDTAARSDQDGDDITHNGTEEGELDSLDLGLHAFHEPSDSGLQQSGDTVLPTHDGLGTFQPDAAVDMWQFERQPHRRQHARRRSSVQRRLDILDEAEETYAEQDRRQRIEQWRLEQSRVLLEEIQKESRRRRRRSMASVARSRTDSAQLNDPSVLATQPVSVGQSVSSSDEENEEDLPFLQRLTRKVIRDLIGLDDNTLSVIFGESLMPEDATALPTQHDDTTSSIETALRLQDEANLTGEPREHRLLERIARELGILVHQISEHPGAFSTYKRAQETPEYAGLPPTHHVSGPGATTAVPSTSQSISPTPDSSRLAPTISAQQTSTMYSEASLWGIEEESLVDPLNPSQAPSTPVVTTAEELVHEQEYWERELDVKMVFNFLLRRFTSQRARSVPPGQPRGSESGAASAHRAAIIRQNHPLVGRNAERIAASSSMRENRRKDSVYRQHFNHPSSLRSHVLKSNSSCASQSTKKSKRSAGSGRNYWDLGGSVGSGSVLAGEA